MQEEVETKNEDDPDDETYQPETEETRALMSDEDTDDCDSLVHDRLIALLLGISISISFICLYFMLCEQQETCNN